MILFFDFDGPILDVSTRYYQAYVKTLKFYNSSFLSQEEYWDLKRKKKSDLEILKLSNKSSLLDKYQAKRNEIIESKNLLKLDIIWPELFECYEQLFSKYKGILITLRNNHTNTLWQIDKLRISSWFQKVICVPSGKVKKDRWKLKASAIEKLQIDKITLKNSYFTGDTETDILAGKNFNMKTLGVSFGIREKNILNQSNPDLIFETPIQLYQYIQEFLL